MSNQLPRLLVCLGVAVSLLTATTAAHASRILSAGAVQAGPGYRPARVRTLSLVYRAHNGAMRDAFVRLPAWYGRDDDPRLPLVISPHGRGVSAESDCRSWARLPAIGRFAVICPAGQGAHLPLDSWGAPGQIADLARMPQLVHERLPWLRIERHHVYAVGGSMGGEEVLLMVGRYPHLLAGAIAFDSVANLARQYYDLPRLRCDSACLHKWKQPIGIGLQMLMREEVGGIPATNPKGYAERSPLQYARQIAFSGVPLELWWSRSDLIVPEQREKQSGALFARILHLNPSAPVEEFYGDWRHSYEERATSRLPFALAQMGLLPPRYGYLGLPNQLHEVNLLSERDLAQAAIRHA
jgi:pimeloyl-ACP methyl ester carboxylesterase